MTLQEHKEYDRWIASKANRAALAQMEEIWSALDGHEHPPAPHLARKVMVAALCASVGLAILSLTSNSAFWTSLDWANR